MRVYVDHTHLGRHVTGLERITLELFSREALAPLDVAAVTARGTVSMVATQTFGLPLRLMRHPSSLLLCPGFPPSPLLQLFGARTIPYIHDLFLLTRRSDLNMRARLYMTLPFTLAVRRLPRFLANSEDTRRKLAMHCRPDAEITLYRPQVRNVFDLRPQDRVPRIPSSHPLRLVALGTVEPRKNFVAAGRLLAALRERGFAYATLDIIGRRGWGEDWTTLSEMPGVTLHGYQPAERVREILNCADALLCTSHEEGLGLPLLEAQYAGLTVIAPDQPVFREVLGTSGIHVDPAALSDAADRIAGALSQSDWRTMHAEQATRNLMRWNGLATADRQSVIAMLDRLVHDQAAPGSLPRAALGVRRPDFR